MKTWKIEKYKTSIYFNIAVFTTTKELCQLTVSRWWVKVIKCILQKGAPSIASMADVLFFERLK